MKTTIRDKDLLYTLKPNDLMGYLRSNGWKEEEHKTSHSIWLKEYDGEEIEIFLPLETRFKDYPQRMVEVLQNLEIAEQRDQMAIFYDLQNTTYDIIRLRLDNDKYKDGTIPIEHGVTLVERSRDLLLASACAAYKPKAVYHSRKPNQALDYMKKIRMGQTEHGSYILLIRSPIRPALKSAEELFERDEEPFERHVVTTLMKSLNSLKDASSISAASGELKPFLDSIPNGISSNLCDAVVGLCETTESNLLDVQTTWSPSRKPPTNIRQRLSINSDSLSIIKEASSHLRESSPVDEFELQGTVIRLDRETQEGSGTVTVKGIVEDKLKKIKIELSQSEYEKAIEAHKEGLTIICEGELKKEGRSLVLHNPRDFSIEEED